MKETNIRKALWEATKEPLRWVVLAAIPVLLVYLEKIPYAWAVLATLFLRFADKFIHTLGKEEEEGTLKEVLLKGLTRF